LDTEPQTETKKKPAKRLRKRFWILLDLGILFIFLSLLFYRPFVYKEPKYQTSNQVGGHWTKLSSQIYNNAQLARPFEIQINQEEVNRMVLDSGWPKASGSISFSSPEVFLKPGQIILIGTAAFEEVKFFVTVAGRPEINESGKLNLKVTKLKVGALNVTLIARIMAQRSYSKAFSDTAINKDDTGAKILASLLNNEPFEPVFIVEDKKVRISAINILEEKIIIDFVPVID
jgi:uncharacterized protein YpmS